MPRLPKRPAPKRAPNGAGSVFQLKDGRWRARDTWTNPDGSPGKKEFEATTEEAAEAKLAAFKIERDRLGDAADPLQTVEQFLRSWLAGPVASRRPQTIKVYTWAVGIIIERIGDRRLGEVRPAHIQALFTALTRDGYSPSTIAQLRRNLRTAFGHAVDLDLLTRNPVRGTKPPAPVEPSYHILTPIEAVRLLAASRDDPYETAYWLFATEALRINEALGLRWADVDFGRAELHLRNQHHRVARQWQPGPLKNKASMTTLPLLPDAAAALVRQQARAAARRRMARRWEDRDLVFPGSFGQPLSQGVVRSALTRACVRAGLPRVKPHELRHAAATIALAQGIELRFVQAILRHASIGITADVYTHVDLPMLRAAMDRLGGAFAGDNASSLGTISGEISGVALLPAPGSNGKHEHTRAETSTGGNDVEPVLADSDM